LFDHLRRLATTGAAYTAASVFSKLVAVALLPLYTAHLTPDDYGAAEILIVAVIAFSIVIRFGLIEALLRFYYLQTEEPNEVVRTGFAALFWTTTAGALICLPFAGPISEALLDRSEPGLVRIAIGGLWIFTLYEYLVALLRLDERARAYFAFTMANTLAAIPLTAWLVVAEDEGALGLLVGTYGAAIPFALWLVFDQRRRIALVPHRDLLGRLYRFGMPTMPAELTLYSLSFIDRILIARLAGLAEAGLYAIAVKFAQAITVLVRGFQLAWPPLAYSVTDDDEARRVYAAVVTWFTAICAFAVIGLWLEARWIVRLFAADEYFEAHEAVGLVALGTSLYAVYLVLVVILGRTGRTERSIPATAAASVANIALNVALVPPLGIVGAGLALVGSYLIVIALMYRVTQRLFFVPYEWGRLALVVGAAAALIAGGELLLPTEGAAGALGRGAVWLAYPAALWFGGFLPAAERARLVDAFRRAAQPPAEDADTRSPGELAIEAERRDEDARPA
jgi:O-antigen/teichoic acid export membrane protein